MSTHEIQSRRSEPAAWSPLLALAEAAIPQAGEQWHDSEEMRLVYDSLQELFMTELNEVSFYGHSLVICEVAKELRSPAVRDHIVEDGADALINASAKGKGGISAIIGDPSYLQDAYSGIARQGYDRRPLAEHIVGDIALGIVMDRRDGDRPRPWIPRSLKEKKYSELSADLIGRMNREEEIEGLTVVHERGKPAVAIVESIQRSPIMETIVGQNMILSAIYIAAHVLHTADPGIMQGALPSQDTIDILQHPSSKQAALQATHVRSREFFDIKNPIVKVVDGQLQFVDPLHGQKRPRPSRRRDILHYGLRGRRYYERDEPLTCPAESVRGMVPLSLDLIGRIVAGATDRLRADNA